MPARDCKYSRDSRGTALRSPVAAAAAALVVGAAAASAADLPAGFSWVTAADGFVEPVTIRFTPGGTMLIAEQCGAVYVVEEGVRQPQPLIDLTAEVNAQNDRGLLGLAVDPMFDENGYVYFLYTVDPVEGERDEPASDGSAGRLTRYTTIESKGALVADPATRFVLLGDPLDTGTPCCWKSHAVGAMHFATDGSLFVSTGDGALYSQADAGGLTPNCFLPPLFDQSEDIGAFRSQRLESLGGKILRIDPATGLGLPDNPFFTGDASDNRSRVFASGLRNPFRFSIRPGSPAPGTIYVGDVGWGTYEELNVVTGGENFGWPCLEGPIATPGYDQATPASNGCDTIETAENPGPLTSPLMHWHHWQPANSSPVGIVGRAPSSTTFYDGTTYPSMYQGALFQVDL
ncbi:MAG: PQQ-dependent sugar dehydrogenase, partial [Planctomycetota bacterium]